MSKLRAIQETKAPDANEFFLEPLLQTDKAVFQTYGTQTSMGQRYVELLKARQLGSAFVGPDNHIVDPGSSSRTYSSDDFFQMNSSKSSKISTYPCLKCKASYRSLYAVVAHMKKGK